jgi:raffinose/stachyose/melibiose transport system substrate-binding protein
MKKFITSMVALLVVATLLAGCTKSVSESDTSKKGDKELTFTFMTAISDETRTAVIDKGLEILKEKYPNVNFVNDSGGDYGQKMKLAFSSGEGYDLVFVDDLLQQTFVQDDYLMELTPHMSKYNWVERSVPGAVEFNNLRTPGKTYSIGSGVSSLMVYYNKDIYEELGLEIPTTLEEFEANCDAILKAGYIPSESSKDNTNFWYIQSMVLNGAPKAEIDDWYYNRQITPAVEQAFIDAATTYQSWVKKGYFREGFEGVDYGDLPTLFAQGDSAMSIDGNWFVSAYESTGINVGVFPFPGNREKVDKPYIVGAIDAGWALNNELDEQKTQIGLDFIDVMMSEELAIDWYEAGSMPTINTDYSAANATELSKEFLEKSNGSNVGFFLDNVKPGYLDRFTKETQLLMLGESTPEQFWNGLEEEWNK